MRILAVDNNPVILKLLAHHLGQAGHEVKTARDGLNALEVLEDFRPDAMVVDLIMPNINGEKLCRILRRSPKFTDLYIIVLTAIAAESRLDVTRFGADACIAKGPFQQVACHLDDLLARIESGQPSEKIHGLENLYQREITKELLSTQNHHQVILNHLTEGIFELHPSGKVIYANPAALLILGRQEEQLLGTRFPMLFTAPERPRLERLLALALEGGMQSIPEETPLLYREKQLLLRILPVREPESRSLMCLVSDVTRRKEIEQELEIYQLHLEELVRTRNAELLASNRQIRKEIAERQRMEEALRQSQKMEALGTLAEGIAHDFNNILQSILGHTELMRNRLSQPPALTGSLDEICRAAHRAGSLVQRILTFSRKNVSEKKEVYLQELSQEVLLLIESVLPKNIRVHQKIDSDCRPVAADPGQLHQVLLNLYTNAIQAMDPQGGTLEIGLQEVEIGPEVAAQHLELRTGLYLRLTVADSGRGMDSRTIRRIFEPYFTTKKSGEGTGLGLAVVHGIVKEHGGAILVQSTPDKGSTFRVFLPVLPTRAAGRESAGANLLQPLHKRVLLITADSVGGREAARLLSETGCEAVVATGPAALEVLIKDPQSIDITLLDADRSELPPVHLLEQLLFIRPTLPVVLMAAEGRIETLAAQLPEVSGWLTKPLRFGPLYQLLKQIGHQVLH